MQLPNKHRKKNVAAEYTNDENTYHIPVNSV